METAKTQRRKKMSQSFSRLRAFAVNISPEALFFFCLFIVSLLISFQLNFPDGKPKGGTEFFADKAMYYVYLPATFIYQWDVKKFPEKMDEKTRGFTLHMNDEKVIIKATYGVALMLSPFFIPVHITARIFNLQPDGFSGFYQKAMTIPALIYLVAGLFFLLRFLYRYLPGKVAFGTVFLLYAGTNLFFYSVDEGLMSHVYSFFLASAALLSLKTFLERNMKPFSLFLMAALIISLAALVRPTNLALVSLFLFLDVRSFREVRERILFFIRPKYILTFLLILFLLYVPQMIYWKYLSGSFLYNSYPNEGFSNWQRPMLFPLWFAPLNGFFLYTPMALFFTAGLVLMIIRRIPNGIFFTALFLFMSIVFASWHCWFFAGSLGMRPFIDLYPLLALPLGYFFVWIIKRRNLFIRSLWILFMIIFTYYNVRLAWHYNFFPGSVWSWDDYKIYLSDAGIQHFQRKTYTYINDFENNTLPDGIPRSKKAVHSRTLSSHLDSAMEFNCKYSRRFNHIIYQNPVRAEAGIWFLNNQPGNTGAFFVCSIDDTLGRNLYYRSVNIDKFAVKQGEWARAEEVFHFPEWIPSASVVSFYVWNPQRSRFYVDDMKIQFE